MIDTSNKSVSIIHDYFTQIGGAERVVAQWVAHLHEVGFQVESVGATVANPALKLGKFYYGSVETSWLHRFPPARRDPRSFLPLLPFAARMIPLSRTPDVVLTSTSGFAHLARARRACKVVYWHTPPRWLYEANDYRMSLSRPQKIALAALSRPMRWFDGRMLDRTAVHLANSSVTQKRLLAAYGITAQVLHPPVTPPAGPAFKPDVEVPAQFFLVVGRGRGYKNIELVEQAARSAGKNLVVVGVGGSERSESGAISRILRLSNLPDGQLRWLYKNALALIAASREDFGLTPVEANLLGTPAITARAGGFLETTNEGISGVHFKPEDLQSLTDALVTFDPPSVQSGSRHGPRKSVRSREAHETALASTIRVD